MKDKEIWKTLKLEPTKNEDDIVNAYRSLVVTVHPEEDPEGFKKLREAYEAAIRYSRIKEEPEAETPVNPDELNEYDRITYDATVIYDNYKTRIDTDKWDELLDNSIFFDLDTSDKARETLLVFLLDRFYLTHETWVKINKVLMVEMDMNLLTEQFPESFLQYIVRHATQEDEIELEYLIPRNVHDSLMADSGLTDKPLAKDTTLPPDNDTNFDTEEDTYLCKLFDLKYQVDLMLVEANKTNEAMKEHILKYFSYLENQDYWHPVEYVEKMRYYYHTGEINTALDMAKTILFDEAIPHIFYTVGEASLILLLEHESLDADTLLKVKQMAYQYAEDTPNNYPLMIDKALILYIDKDYENASEKIVDIINTAGEEPQTLKILELINVNLIATYKERCEKNPSSSKDAIQLARYLCQLDRWQEAIDNLLDVKIDDEWICDYYWFIGRSYYETGNYKECIPYLQKWNEYLEDIVNETKDANIEELPLTTQHRLNRRFYGYAILGRALTKEKRYKEAEDTYDLLISFSDEPGHIIPSLVDKVLMYQDCGDYQTALRIVEKILSDYGQILPIVQLHQDIAYMLDEPQMVIDDFYKIIAENSMIFRPYLLAFRTFLKYDQTDDAKNILKQVKEHSFDTAGIDFMEISLELSNISSYKEASSLMSRLLKLKEKADKAKEDNPDNISLEPSDISYEIAALASRIIDAGDETDIRPEVYAKEAYKNAPDNWDYKSKCMSLLVSIYGDSMDSAELIKLLAKDENPGAEIYYACGSHYASNNDYRQAIPMLLRTLEIDPSHKEAHYRLMHMYLLRYTDYEDAKDIDAARKEADLQLENLNTSYYYVERALLYQRLNKHEKALSDFNNALVKSPNNVYAYNGIGRTLTIMGRYEEAIRSLNKAIELVDNDDISIPFENLVRCYESEQRYSEALKAQQDMMKRFGNNVTDSNIAARLAIGCNEFDLALSYYEDVNKMLKKYLKDHPGNRWAIYRTCKYFIDTIECYILSGKNDSDAEQKLHNRFKRFLSNYGLILHPKEKTKLGLPLIKKGKKPTEAKEAPTDESLWDFYSDIYTDVGMFLMYTMNDYRLALIYFTRQDMYRNYDAKSCTVSDRNLKGDTKRHIALCYAFLGESELAQKYAAQALEWYLYYISEEQYLINPRNRAHRITCLAQCYYLTGNAHYKEILDSLNTCSLCEYCLHPCCYEEFLIRARLAELDKDYENAFKYYQLSYDLAPNDCEAKLGIKRCLKFV